MVIFCEKPLHLSKTLSGMKLSQASHAVCFAIVLAFVSLLSVSCGRGGKYVSIAGFAQGGTYTVKINLYGKDGKISASPAEVKAGVDSVLARIERSVSGYDKGSLLSRFNAGERVVPDDIFIELYEYSYRFYELTDGAFDVSAGPLFDIWGFGFKGGGFPSDDAVERTRSACGMSRLRPDIANAVAEDGTICGRDLLVSGDDALPALNFNAIAQGYSCDIVARYLYSLGVKDMLVDVGGEIYCDGVNPSGGPWKIGVDKPFDGNDMPGAEIEGILDSGGRPCGIVTSGNYRKFYVHDGKKYAHTVDPRTGYPVSHSLLSATVIAADATTADALATFCMVAGTDAAAEFISSHSCESISLRGTGASPALRGYFISDEDGRMVSRLAE